jgi:hypothetical protein
MGQKAGNEQKGKEQNASDEQELKVKLNKWEAKIDELKAVMDKADAKTRESIYKEVERLIKLKHKANEKLDQMKHAGKESINDVKMGFENVMKDLENAVSSALSRFKS